MTGSSGRAEEQLGGAGGQRAPADRAHTPPREGSTLPIPNYTIAQFRGFKMTLKILI